MNVEMRLENPEDYAGREIFEITPVILGGSPTDPSNKTLLSREDHIKAVVYWNRIIHDVRAREIGNEGGKSSM